MNEGLTSSWCIGIPSLKSVADVDDGSELGVECSPFCSLATMEVCESGTVEVFGEFSFVAASKTVVEPGPSLSRRGFCVDGYDGIAFTCSGLTVGLSTTRRFGFSPSTEAVPNGCSVVAGEFSAAALARSISDVAPVFSPLAMSRPAELSSVPVEETPATFLLVGCSELITRRPLTQIL
ncbi:MAG: hypothetical protein O2955_12310 [Planctomycetota bacterium]|nr:hypothetical protein [Planctomycetota bacterium]MDA1213295.1 hypothetical protein [Planctomycetota bacterium]